LTEPEEEQDDGGCYIDGLGAMQRVALLSVLQRYQVVVGAVELLPVVESYGEPSVAL